MLGRSSPDRAHVEDLGDTHAVFLDRAADEFLVSTDLLYNVSEDPWLSGYVAAVHALSDIYAGLGEPLWAMATLGLNDPSRSGRELLAGVRAGLRADGVPLAGGHTANASEAFVNVAVAGRRPVFRPGAPQEGDIVVVGKRLGTGIALSAIAMGLSDEPAIADEYASMRLSNARSSRALKELASAAHGTVRTVTDVSGFGILAALRHCIPDREVELWLKSLPVFADTRDFIRGGAWPPLADDNLSVAGDYADFVGPFHDGFVDQIIAAAPETSGGLLAVVDPEAVDALVEKDRDVTWWRIARVGRAIGRLRVTDGPAH